MKIYNTLEPGGGKMFKVVIDKNTIFVYNISDNNKVYEIKKYKNCAKRLLTHGSTMSN